MAVLLLPYALRYAQILLNQYSNALILLSKEAVQPATQTIFSLAEEHAEERIR
jgi:ABC-type arginine/histidine transport system permease subunit